MGLIKPANIVANDDLIGACFFAIKKNSIETLDNNLPLTLLSKKSPTS